MDALLGNRSARKGVALLVAIVVGIAVGAVYLASARHPGSVKPATGDVLPAGPRDLMAIFDPAQPLLVDGAKVELNSASSQVGYPLYRIADETPSEAWVNPGVGEAGLRYGTDLVLLYSRWPAGTDVAARYTKMVADWGAGYETSIGGNPAWVVPQDAQEKGFPPVNVVHVSIGDVEVTLFGKMALDQLVTLAGSLNA